MTSPAQSLAAETLLSSHNRGRLAARGILLLTVGALAIWIARIALWPEAHNGAVGFIPWQTWPPFADLRIVLQACDFSRGGGDPLRSSELLYNYPRLWLDLRHLGLTVADTPWLGLALDAVFLACVVRCAWSAAPALTVLTAAALVTPPVMTALERANTDLAIFILLSAAALLTAKTRRVIFAAVGLVLTAVLKLYPAFALLALRTRRRTQLIVAGAIALGFAWQFSDLAIVTTKTPRSHIYAYGASVPVLRLREKGMLGSPRAIAVATAASVAVSLGLGGLALRRGWRERTAPVAFAAEPVLSLPAAGGLIFAATFLLTSNWCYRLVFLLWCLPALPWSASDAKLRVASRVTASAMLCLLWSFAWPARWGLAASHAAALAVLALLAYFAGRLAPRFRSASR